MVRDTKRGEKEYRKIDNRKIGNKNRKTENEKK